MFLGERVTIHLVQTVAPVFEVHLDQIAAGRRQEPVLAHVRSSLCRLS